MAPFRRGCRRRAQRPALLRTVCRRLEFRMIDFTHVRREGVADDGYIHGLRRLVDILAALQRD